MAPEQKENEEEESSSGKDSLSIKKRFITFLLPSAIVLAIVMFLLYDAEARTGRVVLETNEIYTVDYRLNTIENLLDTIIADLTFISAQNEVYSDGGELNATERELFSREISSFLLSHKSYGRISMYDTGGIEIITVFRDNQGTEVRYPNTAAVGNNREIFDKTITLPRDNTYMLHSLHDNTAGEKTSAAFYFGVPVYDINNEKRGVIILDYTGAELAEIVKKETTGARGDLFILCPDGYNLTNLFVEGDKKTSGSFITNNPQIWERIQASSTGQLMTKEGLFTFTTFYPLPKKNPGYQKSEFSHHGISRMTLQHSYWKIISFVPRSVLSAETNDIRQRFLFLFGIFVILLEIISWYLARSSSQRDTAEKRVKHLNQVLEAIRHVEHIIFQETDRETLCSKICESLIRTRGYATAWLVLFDRDGRYLLARQAGIGDNFRFFEEKLSQGLISPCMRRAFESENIIFYQSPGKNCEACSLIRSQPATTKMIASLRYGSRTFGVLSTTLQDGMRRDQEEENLFREVAQDIAFALHSMEVEEDRLRTEEMLKESEERMRTLLNATPDYVNFKDDQGRWLIANDACVKIFRLEGVDYRGKTSKELAEYSPLFSRAIPNCGSTDEVAWKKQGMIRNEMILPQDDGSERVFDVLKVPLFHSDGRRKALVVLGRDITGRKESEREIIRKNRELNDFTYQVSHDLKNPVHILKGFLTIIKNDPSFFGAYYERIMRQADNLMAFIDELLKLSRAGRVIDEKQEIDVETMLERIFVVTKPENVPGSLRIEKPLPRIMGDSGRIEQVLTNLIQNAVKYRDTAKEKLSIDVWHTQEENFIVYHIKDNGIGINKEHSSRVFDAGFTASKGSGSGSGFGLAIVRKIIEAHGGSAWVQSPGQNQGIEVFIRLPKNRMSKFREASPERSETLEIESNVAGYCSSSSIPVISPVSE